MTPLDKGSRADSPVVAYKRLLQQILDRRPSGMRQRLAEALGKNRSFITQISNPAYPTPILPQHAERIFEICHFATHEREEFLAAYYEAHPRRRPEVEAYNAARRLIESADLVVVRSLVGNYVTSLEMAGCSITLSLLDPELTAWWDAPVHTAALRWG
jgi:hypothetical protein